MALVYPEDPVFRSLKVNFKTQPFYTTSRLGRPVLQLGPHRFNQTSQNEGPKSSWRDIFLEVQVWEACDNRGKVPVQQVQPEFRAQGALAVCEGSLRLPRDQVRFVTSIRGNQMIVYNRHRFSYNKSTIGSIPKKRWVCTRWSNGCRASLTTLQDTIIKCNDTHTH
ncbi:unnamed protein product [Chrysodeixis includens]|uniref:FLYWCH-type domain-containing protein n=1 Tax=Chrysodeixis includens TaxID=689277 RepID=A0A9N8L129_CHRIL|nr:unnamed protein product [Chrysodeixis includens]